MLSNAEWFYVTSDEGHPRGNGWEVHATIIDKRTQAPVGHPFAGYGETRADAKDEAEASARRRALRISEPVRPRYT
jgi:hypothetical protein